MIKKNELELLNNLIVSFMKKVYCVVSDWWEKGQFVYVLNIKSFLKVHILKVQIFLMLFSLKCIGTALFSHSNLKLEVGET